MKVSIEMFSRWKKYCRLLLAENKMAVEDVSSPVMAWNVAFKLDIPKEAYPWGSPLARRFGGRRWCNPLFDRKGLIHERDIHRQTVRRGGK